MEIETKIFDTKKIRKILKKKKMSSHRVSDIHDYIFEIEDFSPDSWHFVIPENKKNSGKLLSGWENLEIPNEAGIKHMQEFFQRKSLKWCKIRIRVVDGSPYLTLKWPKNAKNGIKSREEIEVRVSSLSIMMKILLNSGAILEKTIPRTREIYLIEEFPESELVIDSFVIAGESFEYAEIESSTESELALVLEDFFEWDVNDYCDDRGIVSLHKQNAHNVVMKKLQDYADELGV